MMQLIQVELELAHAKEEIERLENLTYLVHSCGEGCKRPMCVLRRERDSLKQQVEKLKEQLEQSSSCLLIANKNIDVANADLKWRKEHMAKSDKELCQIEDWLRAGGEILQSSSDVAARVKERIRDLIAKEGELGDAHHQLLQASAHNAKLRKLLDEIGFFCAGNELNKQEADAIASKVLQALSDPPDQALAEWVEFVSNMLSYVETMHWPRQDEQCRQLVNKARQLLATTTPTAQVAAGDPDTK